MGIGFFSHVWTESIVVFTLSSAIWDGEGDSGLVFCGLFTTALNALRVRSEISPISSSVVLGSFVLSWKDLIPLSRIDFITGAFRYFFIRLMTPSTISSRVSCLSIVSAGVFIGGLG